ncbi:MAG: sulfate/molybdate ABC transporter ATP-binding protein [Gracilibacteraceae bacterium]|jgi:molybdate transport system ATP-binding protein|nr:sulfate/molybdate ABC transporter ATP-binding protein [Gracilibacteraceae bacterium]
MTLRLNISKELRQFRLHMVFEAGSEVMALLGASGCGKSMTLKCIAGVETPDEGRIELNGRVLFDSSRGVNLPPRERRVGYLFQNYALFPHMTVEENIAVGIRRPRAERAVVVREKIQAFYLTGLEKAYPPQLSGGQQQRVALARILASEPEIMLLDEPFSALDSYLKWQTEKELMAVTDAFPGTTLFVSHDRDEAYRMCTRVAVLHDGKIDVLREREDLMRNPETISAARITGCKNFSRARRTDLRRLWAADWGVSLQTGADLPPDLSYVGYRAHYIKFCPAPAAERADNALPCRLRAVIEDTFSSIILLEAAGAEGENRIPFSEEFSVLRVEMPKTDWRAIAAGQDVSPGAAVLIRLDPEKLLPLRESGGIGKAQSLGTVDK